MSKIKANYEFLSTVFWLFRVLPKIYMTKPRNTRIRPKL